MSVTKESPDVGSAPSVLWKAFDVLGSFSPNRRALTLSEISRRSGLPKSTVHRVLAMLLEVKAVERDGQGYRVGLNMFAMGTCSAEVALRDLALPHLHRLRRLTGQTVHLAVRQGFEVVYLEKLASSSSSPTPALVGGRLPAHACGVGKALLAFAADELAVADVPASALSRRTTATVNQPEQLRSALEQVRLVGLATDREEAVRGLACVAAPVLVNSVAVAAVSVAFPVSAGSGESFITSLRETTAAIARAATSSSTTAASPG